MVENGSMEERFRYDCSGNWYKGSVHVHTTNGSGRKSLPEAAAFYAEAGYDFICVTDKNIPIDKAALAGKLPLLVVDGMELEGFDAQGSFYHVVCLGGIEGVTKDMTFMDTMEHIRSQGGILIWAHPHSVRNTPEEGERHQFNGIEVYNHINQVAFGMGFAQYHWDAVLEQQPDLLGFATDDAHFQEMVPGERGGWIMVNAPELSEKALLSAIRKGNFYSSNGPAFESIIIEQGNRVVAETSSVVFARMTGERGRYKYKGTGERIPITHTNFRIPADWIYARLEIEDEYGKIAWSNPLLRMKK
jgi:hypothetical protein